MPPLADDILGIKLRAVSVGRNGDPLVTPYCEVFEVDGHSMAHEESHPGVEAVVKGGVGAVRDNECSLRAISAVYRM